ncbi:MAG: asparagine synthase (glutamine-hydrolyzing) [Armatimonadota bacterium]|nr:asparagine synthase (glutamine-hydrolyzing) [Armatimonadota bacterium]
MCGIAGVVGLADGNARVARMLAAMRHRGPDDEGIVQVAPGLWLGNCRLAILDLTPAGRMPMEASGAWITYNGEVYNFADLRTELERAGWRFRSRTDTEVVIAAWVAWGEAALRRLRGMFALALYDPRRRELVLARDPLGEKPLYYAVGSGWFAFASEVRALLASGLVARRLDPRAVTVYLYNGFSVDPLTLVDGVRALLPGHYLRVGEDGRVRSVERFWLGPFAESPGERVSPESLHARFEEAVRIRLVADVPVGAFLSGGLDSTAVAGAMARSSPACRTFTVALPGSPLDESAWAREVAKRLGTAHSEVKVGADLQSWLEGALGALDQPSFDGVNTYLVARAVREAGLTVALSGLGGDELFGGYPFLRHAWWLARILAALGPAKSPAQVLGRLAALSGPGKLLAALEVRERELLAVTSYQATQVLFPARHLAQLQRDPARDLVAGLPEEFVAFLQEEVRRTSLADRLGHLALRIFCGQRTLRDTDAVSMAVSLEVRLPFLDRLLVEEAFALPGAVRLRGIPDKPLEQHVVGPLLPPGYPRREKHGFTLPFAEWLRPGGLLHEFAASRLEDDRLARRAGLRPEQVRELLGRADHVPWSRLWALVALLDWVARTGVEA